MSRLVWYVRMFKCWELNTAKEMRINRSFDRLSRDKHMIAHYAKSKGVLLLGWGGPVSRALMSPHPIGDGQDLLCSGHALFWLGSCSTSQAVISKSSIQSSEATKYRCSPWQLTNSVSRRYASILLCNPSRCIFQVSQRLCSEVCKRSNLNISMRWNDEWAGLICGDSNLDNTPLLSVYGGNKHVPFKPRWSGLYNYYM